MLFGTVTGYFATQPSKLTIQCIHALHCPYEIVAAGECAVYVEDKVATIGIRKCLLSLTHQISHTQTHIYYMHSKRFGIGICSS